MDLRILSVFPLRVKEDAAEHHQRRTDLEDWGVAHVIDRETEAQRQGSLEREGATLSTTQRKHGVPWELEGTLENVLN